MRTRSNEQPVVRIHLWLETGGGIYFGLGRLKLLERIQTGQSLSGAARSLGMSYRAAWGKIKNTEDVLGVALIEKTSGNRSGYRLTEAGSAMVDRFRRWFTDVEKFALHRAAALLHCRPIAYRESHDTVEGVESGDEASAP